jgi:hypothetical protein
MTTTTPASGLSLWTMVRRSVLLWVGTLFLILGLVFLTIGIRTLLEEHAYKTQGLAMQAVVLDKTLVRANRQDNPHTRYLVVYRFTSANGEVSDRTADVPVEEWERLEPGQTFPVTYLPDKANSSRVPNGDEWIAALVFSIIGGVFTLLGGGLAFFEARDLVRAVRVSHQGLITDGTVLRASPTSTSINRVPQWRVHYRYRDHFGRTQEGASHLMSPEEASAWKEGDHGSVRFDREQPEFSVWMGTT